MSRRTKTPTVSLLSLLVLALMPGHSWAGRQKLTKDQIAKLEKGELINSTKKMPGTSVTAGQTIAIVEDVPEAVVYVLLAVDKYKHFLPRVTDSRIVKRRGWHLYSVIHTDLPWPVKDCWVYIKSTRYDMPGRVYEVKWWMLNGTMKNYTGVARVEPYNKSATQSLLTYRMLSEPKTAAPDSLISKGVTKVVTTIVNRIRLRLKALRKYKKMPKGL
jgi:hypothetical protein